MHILENIFQGVLTLAQLCFKGLMLHYYQHLLAEVVWSKKRLKLKKNE